MRFAKDGPDIPDNLLNDRDSGSVVFFCGSGVSRHLAKLPDFFGLANAVLDDLRVAETAEARRLLIVAKEIEDRTNLTGLVSADRIFSLLEVEYDRVDIQRAVARCLSKGMVNDLCAHQTVLRLARTQSGNVQLITTNFDRLFEDCDSSIPSYLSPRLPDLAEQDNFHGIVYLHGRVGLDYTCADSSGLILSTSEFGNAYLSDAWATDFFKKLVSKFSIVFLGYSGDDPPIHYLLEGLRRSKIRANPVYAFEQPSAQNAFRKWRQKNVIPIGFEGYDSLWESLELWAKRADSPSVWHKSVLQMTECSPRKLTPVERGQVVHVVSTFDGARSFYDRLPSSEWLWVFDPKMRYYKNEIASDSSRQDSSNFDLYSIDSDEPPQHVEEPQYADNGFPLGAKDVFAIGPIDRLDIENTLEMSSKAFRSTTQVRLPKRLECLGQWIADTIETPATFAWCQTQSNLHSDLKYRIQSKLDRVDKNFPHNVARAWRYLLESWNGVTVKEKYDWFMLANRVERSGWDLHIVRKIRCLLTPRIQVLHGTFQVPHAPSLQEGLSLRELINAEVQIAEVEIQLEIPDEWLFLVVKQLTEVLFEYELLSNELCSLHYLDYQLVPLEQDSDCWYGRNKGFAELIVLYAATIERIARVDRSSANNVLQHLPQDSKLFQYIRIWACTIPDFFTFGDIANQIINLDDYEFWSHTYFRYLRKAVENHWDFLSSDFKQYFEQRVRSGPTKREQEDDDDYAERKEIRISSRLNWLNELKIQKSANSSHESISEAIDDQEIRSGFVQVDTNHNELKDMPHTEIIVAARKIAERRSSNFLVEFNPFKGLCQEMPMRALDALAHSSTLDGRDYPNEEWVTFFDAAIHREDSKEFATSIANSLLLLNQQKFAMLLYYSTWWFEKSAKKIKLQSDETFCQLLEKFSTAIRDFPELCGSAIVESDSNTDWVMEAINSPVGRLVDALLELLRDKESSQYEIAAYLNSVNNLLQNSDRRRCHALTILSLNLLWLDHSHESLSSQVIAVANNSTNNRDWEATWAGILWSPRVNVKLLLAVKNMLFLIISGEASFKNSHMQSLSFLLLKGWLENEGSTRGVVISDEEFHNAAINGGETFCAHLLRQLARYVENENAGLTQRLDNAEYILKRVWPQQLAMRTPLITASLIDLLFSTPTAFSYLTSDAIGLMVKLTNEQQYHFHLSDEDKQNLAKENPRLMLKLLTKILPDSTNKWPYGFADFLELLKTAEPTIVVDPEFESLRRRWEQRW